jgi:AAA domain
VALSGIAAESLESGSGISSRTIASMEHSWQQGRDALTSRDVLVIDEAGTPVRPEQVKTDCGRAALLITGRTCGAAERPEFP